MKTLRVLLLWLLIFSPPIAAQNLEADMNLLTSEVASERARAACRLADMKEGARDAIEPLIALLGDDTPVEWDVCRGIGRRGDVRWYGNGMNCDRYRCDPTTPGRQAAAALAQTGSHSVPAVEQVLTAGIPHARRNAAWVLGAFGLERSIDPLARALQDDHDPVREQAAWALGAIGKAEGATPLMRALHDSHPEVRENAAWALGAIGDHRATQELIRALTDEVPDVRENVAWALGAIGDETATEGLIRALTDEVADVRENVAWALGAIGDERAVEPLIKVFEDDDNNDVRRNAIWALRAIH